mmetsp:Transcript_115773/g.332603  ORF Transcript_115773/g.332603 Transcript_115773/m.332603 type:complete len:225 (-) Transcript_115773:1189-1863(-)
MSKRIGVTPSVANLSNNDVPRPSTSASKQATVAGNCRWSPTNTTEPSASRCIIGISDASSVVCPASSMSTLRNCWSCMAGCSAPLQVQHTTSASCKTRRSAFQLCLGPPGPPAARARSKRLQSCKSGLLLSLRPTRTTFNPAAPQPATRLSAAMLLSAVAKTGFRPVVAHSRISKTAVLVFPAPGGPWINETRRVVAARNASNCERFAERNTGDADGKPAFGGK